MPSLSLSAQRGEGSYALLYIDLDQFKQRS
jgi:GGDEF domain-containing protein